MSNQNIARIIDGNWNQLKGKVKKNWARLSNDDVTAIEGSYDNLIGKIKETYGFTANEAELQVNSFIKQLGELKEEVSSGNGFQKELLENIRESVETCKARLGDIEETVYTYLKSNPLKAVGVAAVVGFAAAKLLDLTKR